MLFYEISSHSGEKPKDDMSIITDYDQRYLNYINKIFKKEFYGWDYRNGVENFNEILEGGGQMAAFWHRGKIVGAIIWHWGGEEGKITHICFKANSQRQGFGRLLVDFALYHIRQKNESGRLFVEISADDKNANFFKKIGFAKVGGDG